MRNLIAILALLSLGLFAVACDDDDDTNNNNITNNNNTNTTNNNNTNNTTNNNNNTNSNNQNNPVGDGAVGEACYLDSHCDDGLCMGEVSDGFPAGYCSQDCSADGVCADSNAVCLDISGGFGIGRCLETCTLGGSDCRDGYECVDAGEGLGICWASCTGNDECVLTGICDTEGGFCQTLPEVCDSGEDEDLDGDVDCADSDCANEVACGCPEDDMDNHEGGSAYEIDITTLPSTTVSGHICGPVFEDWFVINPDMDASLQIELSFTHADGDLDLAIMDSNFEQINGSAGTDDGETVIQSVESGETYYIQVTIWGDGNNGYDLDIDYGPADVSIDVVTDPVSVAPGDDVTLDITFTNNGGTDSTNAVATLSSTDADVTINNGTANLGTIAMAGGTASDNTLTFTVAASHMNNMPVELELNVTDDEGNDWTYPVVIEVPYASLGYTNDVVTDAGGDGNVDPDEAFDFAFDAVNNGDAAAVGPVTATVVVGAGSTATGVTVTAPASTECSATDMAPAGTATCSPWTFTVPATAANGETVVLEITFTDGNGDSWMATKTIYLGPPSYQSLLTAEDASGDNDAAYACDLRDFMAYVANGTLFIRTTFHSACTVSGLHDVYMLDSAGNGILTLTLEAGAVSIWANDGSGWTQPASPASFSISQTSGSTDTLDFEIDIADVPVIDMSTNSVDMAAAVDATLDEEYADYAPDADPSTGDLIFSTFTW